ncbi:protein AMBP isoform X2 [Amia ocellicauda]|uniref:protein AMBP isoform X2 n=1 Tax=Amia ocellicauda TaxID=2972642 RepID=UPI00346457EA
MMAPLVLFLLSAWLALAWGGPLPDRPEIQVQENFDMDRFLGKWYDIALASSCPWVQKHKHRMTMGTLDLQATDDVSQIAMTTTSVRHGVCKQVSGFYKTDAPGRFTYHNAKWNMDVDSYVVHTNYDEYAIVIMFKMNSGKNSSTTVRLYGRTQELRPSLITDFTQIARDLGIQEDSIITLPKKDECVPGEQVEEPVVKRVQRETVLEPTEGSGDDTTMFRNSDSCNLSPDAGPCFGYIPRFFYNSSQMACHIFTYGGCMGNGNSFVTEKECLQSCRTEAACRLPIDVGPCSASNDLWAFDSQIGKCVAFKYGGCQGNGNKFYSQKECEEYCGVMKDGDDELLGLPGKN